MRSFELPGGQTERMASTKDELRRQRLREYDSALTEARSAVAVLLRFVIGREARDSDGLLEEAFADSPLTDGDQRPVLPAAVWVTMRQGDADATVDMLIRLSGKNFVLGAHEELDAGYRLTTVEERQPLPDLELLASQLAVFLRIPEDVVNVIAGWGPDDPRTAAEIDSLLEQRFGPVHTAVDRIPDRAVAPASPPLRATAMVPEAGGTAADRQAADRPGTGGAADTPGDRATVPPSGADGSLTMSSAEFTALLHLTPQQGAILQTLVRQTAIVIGHQPID